ncbi:MAG: hypothetical protein GXP10_10865 [Gammaproteobacteria bacterium]|nr:hypothetical protein [Gammaproteobacteria bacterium]
MSKKLDNALDRELQQRIDQLLMEQGEYLPLELLLAEGRLFYSDYEAWRNAQLRTLDEALFGDLKQISGILRQAAQYAAALGLHNETLVYEAWGDAPGGRLRFSADSALDALFHRRYCRAQPQLDLFMDATATLLANDIVGALNNRDTAQARCQLERLLDVDPGYNRLGDFELLVVAAERLGCAIDDVDGKTAQLDFVRERLTPVAVDLLGNGGRALLVPWWRRLSDAFDSAAFDAQRAVYHASYCALQAQEWQRAVESIEAEREWRLQPTLLQRYALSCMRLERRADALAAWFTLCWRFADAAAAIEYDGSPELRRAWCEFFSLEPELEVNDFPAWLVLSYPGMALSSAISESFVATWYARCPPSFATAWKLAESTVHAPDAAMNIQLRAELKSQHPALFDHFLARIHG